MKIDNRNVPHKLASDVAELIKTLRITLNATTKIPPFEALFGRKLNTPLSNMTTSPNSSNLSWENTKISCLDQKLLTKPALIAEAMWNRDINSEDELDITYRQQNPPETTDKVATSSATCSKQPLGVTEWDSSDDEIDRQLIENFPKGAHLPLSKFHTI